MEGDIMKRLIQGALVCVLMLAVVSLAAAQGTMQIPSGSAQPTVRLGNFIEMGNDVFMHIIATGDFRYTTTHNFDFDSDVRDRVGQRNPQSTVMQGGEQDAFWMLSRFGVDFRYQKSLELQLVGEQRSQLDGNTSDDRFNSSNPGGTDIFGRAASTENKGLYLKYAWLDYKFEGTPLRMRVGFDLWTQDQAGYIGDNDPRFALFGDFGNLDVMAAAVVEAESQRIGLTDDHDRIYYTFSAGYNLKPHRFQFDVTYFRDRFAGAPVQAGGASGFRGQTTDSVLLMGSWSGRMGPLRALIQGAIMTGSARGGDAAGLALAGLSGAVAPGKHYDVFGGSVVAYAEADLGLVRPWLMFLFASADGDPTDDKLHGFNPYPYTTTIQMTGTSWFAHLDTSNAFARDYSCPARFQGFSSVGASGIPGRTATGGATNPLNVGLGVTTTNANAGFTECTHTVTSPFNDRLGSTSQLGITTTLANPGTFLIPVGVKVSPLKGHEIVGWYMYRGMVNTNVLEIAFAPELAARGMTSIRKAEYQEIGGAYQWTLNPNFDIRLAGNIAFPGGGFVDLGHLANCNPGGSGAYATSARCSGSDPALRGELRFRARF
jgi:hypothetical protein